MPLLFEVLIAIPAFFLLARQILRQHRRGQGNLASTRQAMQTCDQLIRLIGHLQQHRGMSSAWLSGDSSFSTRLSNKRREIDAMFSALSAAAQEECRQASPCLTVNDLSLFRFKWRDLVDNLSTMTVERSITEHSQLIATALEWLNAVGEARIGLAAGDCLPTGLVKNYAHRLPALTECLGQARAIGSSVAAQGSCPAVARVRLMFLVNRAESLIEQACQGHQGNDARSRPAQDAVRSLAALIRSRMLNPEGVINVTADIYFTQATNAIDTVFALILDAGETLEKHLVTTR